MKPASSRGLNPKSSNSLEDKTGYETSHKLNVRIEKDCYIAFTAITSIVLRTLNSLELREPCRH